MKSKDGESPKRLPTVPGLASDAVYDFLYVDGGRVSALYAQLFPQGTLTSVKTTAQHGSSDDSNIGSDIKIFKAETKASDSSSEGIEHIFDASWAVPLEVLTRLAERGLVRSSLKNSTLGSVALLEGFIRIIDYATMKDMWEPAITMFAGEDKTGVKELIGLLKSVPHTMHAHFLTDEAYLWSSLEPANLTVPTTDIVLKHGGHISGQWKVLFIRRCLPKFGRNTGVHLMVGWGGNRGSPDGNTGAQNTNRETVSLVWHYTADGFPRNSARCGSGFARSSRTPADAIITTLGSAVTLGGRLWGCRSARTSRNESSMRPAVQFMVVPEGCRHYSIHLRRHPRCVI